MSTRLRGFLTVSAVALGLVVVPTSSASAAEITAQGLLDSLRVTADVTSGYSRDAFEHWIDEDGDGCDTRQEVLIIESTVPVSPSSSCPVASGSWFSSYDGATWTVPADVDIDHLVPLAEAWRSGADNWSNEQRRAYANDLVIPESLIAVTDNVNQSKGDRDPAQWMPPLGETHCDYVLSWVTVKYRWHLSVDEAERSALQAVLSAGCGQRQVTLPPEADTRPVVPAFADVLGDNQFHTEITWLASQGISTGWPDATFRPLQPVNRDAMAAFLYRLAGRPLFDPPAASPFADVSTENMYYREITWLASEGISTGWPDRTFRPLEAVNRDAMAAFMYRFRDRPAFDAPDASPFRDVSNGNMYYREITWLAANGISTGWQEDYGCRAYQPLQPVNRDAMAAFMYRLANGGTTPVYEGSCNPPAPQPPAPQPPAQPANPGDTKNCTDFRTQREAQAWFDYYYPYYRDVARLDSDGDRIACEGRP